MNDDDGRWWPIFFTGIIGGAVILSLGVIGFELKPPTLGAGMNYQDLAALLLGAVAVLVTVLGVFIAILALWGYSQFRQAAKKAAVKYVASQMQPRGKLRAEIDEQIRQSVLTTLEHDGALRTAVVNRVDEILLKDADRRSNAGAGEFGDEEKEYGE